METPQCYLLVVLGVLILWAVTASIRPREPYNPSKHRGVQAYVLYIPKRLKTIKRFMENIDIKPIYVLGFDKTRIQIEKSLKQGVVHPEWYEYSRNLPPKDVWKHNPVNPGRIACHLGHLKILKLFLKSSARYALVFEDDLYFTPGKIYEQRRKLQIVLENIPKDAQIVYLSYCHEMCNLTRPYDDIFIHAVRPLCRHIYLVSREGAEIILDKTIPMYNTGDKMVGGLIESNRLKGYLVNPEFFSLNQKRHRTGDFRTSLDNQAPIQLCQKEYGSLPAAFARQPKNARVDTHYFPKNYK